MLVEGGRLRGGGKRSCKIGKKELWAVHLVEERILIVIGRGVTAGPQYQRFNPLVTVQCPCVALYCHLSKDRENL